MAKVIRCECGYVARGDDDEALLVDAMRHIDSNHVELAGQLSREDLLAMAEESDMGPVQQESILVEPYAQEQLEVERRIEDIMSAARRRAVDELESYHAFGRKFTKFDDFEPLERQDADTTRRLEREAILGVEEFDPRVVDLKVDVFGPVAVTTFVMDYAVVAEGERHELRARGTLVLANEGGEWLIVHEHFSQFVANG